MLLPLAAGQNINIEQVMSVSPAEASLNQTEGSLWDSADHCSDTVDIILMHFFFMTLYTACV